jgi:glutathione S-transferase
VLQRLAVRLTFTAEALAHQPFLLGNRFSIADAYLFVMLNWHKPLKVDLSRWPALLQFHERVAARPAVRRAMSEEGLL